MKIFYDYVIIIIILIYPHSQTCVNGEFVDSAYYIRSHFRPAIFHVAVSRNKRKIYVLN